MTIYLDRPCDVEPWCCGCSEHPVGKPWGWNVDAWLEHTETHHGPNIGYEGMTGIEAAIERGRAAAEHSAIPYDAEAVAEDYQPICRCGDHPCPVLNA